MQSAFVGQRLGASAFAGQRVQARSSLRVCQPVPFTVEMAHKKGAGSTKNGRDSNSKRRGVKVYGGQPVNAGGIIIRQLGTKVHPGENVGCGKDYTLYALMEGVVVFEKKSRQQLVNVVPFEDYVIPEGQRMVEGSRRHRKMVAAEQRREQEAAALAEAK